MSTIPQRDMPFDSEELRQRCLGQLELARRVMKAFLESGHQTVAEMEQLAARSQWQELRRAAHRFKGASDNVAARRLRHLASEIEASSRMESEDAGGLIAAMRLEWQRFEETGRNFLVDGEDVAATNSVSD